MQNLFLKFNIRVKLAIVFVIALFLSAVSVGFFSYHSARNVVQKDQRKALAEITNLMIMSIDSRVGALGRLLEQGADSRQMKSYVSKLPASASPEFEEYFDAMLNALGYVNAVYIVKNKTLYVPTKQEITPLSEGDYRTLYAFAARFQNVVFWEGMRDPLKPAKPENKRPEQVIRALCGISDSAGGQLSAILVLELKAREFDNVLLSNRASMSYQYRMIFDQNMTLVAANRRLDDTTTSRMLQKYREGQRSFSLDTAHADYFIHGQYDGLTGWTVFSAQEVASAFPSSNELIRLILQFVLLSSLLTSLSVIILSGTITKPVKSLSKAMSRFEKGDFSVRLHPKGKDELGQLMQSFNFMADEIDRLIHQVYGVRLAQQEAEIAALEAQINPHFLYNTLDGIQWMLIKEGQPDIAKIVVSLGKILRYSVDRRQRLVSLSSELQYVDDYLQIQKYRLEDRLQYTVDVPDDIRLCLVPRLILQPLLENAIVHGVEATTSASMEIAAQKEDDLLLISVRDYGKGMAKKRLEEVREQLENADPSHHLGLRNVHRRLKLQFGPDFGLTIESKEGSGCLVTLKLPVITEEKDTPAAFITGSGDQTNNRDSH